MINDALKYKISLRLWNPNIIFVGGILDALTYRSHQKPIIFALQTDRPNAAVLLIHGYYLLSLFSELQQINIKRTLMNRTVVKLQTNCIMIYDTMSFNKCELASLTIVGTL